jgi:hypothetical protein
MRQDGLKNLLDGGCQSMGMADRRFALSIVVSARDLRVERKENGTEKAFVTIDIQMWDGRFHFEVGVDNRGSRAEVLEELRARLVLLFESAFQELSQGPLKFHETQ